MQNLEDLMHSEKPEEPASQSIWKLLNIGWPRDQLRRAVELLGEVSWTTLPSEQQHGTLAAVHRWHPEYNPATLVSRALMLQACRILPQLSKDEKELARVFAKLNKALAKNPDKAGGKQWYMKKVKQLTDRKVATGVLPAEAAGAIGMRRIVARHSVQ